jgi:hypothetical protein
VIHGGGGRARGTVEAFADDFRLEVRVRHGQAFLLCRFCPGLQCPTSQREALERELRERVARIEAELAAKKRSSPPGRRVRRDELANPRAWTSIWWGARGGRLACPLTLACVR